MDIQSPVLLVQMYLGEAAAAQGGCVRAVASTNGKIIGSLVPDVALVGEAVADVAVGVRRVRT